MLFMISCSVCPLAKVLEVLLSMYVYLLNVMEYYKNTYSGMGVNHITYKYK